MSDYKEYRKIILKHTLNNIYLSNPETYELIYINPTLQKSLHIHDHSEYKGQKCYQLLHGKKEPCAFCNNCQLTRDDFVIWDHYNDYLGKMYKAYDKLVETKEGRILRLQIAVDITEEDAQRRSLGLKVESEQVLVRCIHTLSENVDQKKAINRMLQLIGEFYNGARAYIVEFDLQQGLMSNTYEWCNEGVTEEIDNLQDLDIHIIDNWLKEFKEKGSFYLSSVGKNLDKSSLEYQILAAQNIESLIAAPLIENGEIVGFIGVDDTMRNTAHVDLLTSVSYFVLNDIQKRKMVAELERMSFEDMLTGLQNRNKYMHDLKKLEKEQLQTIGIAYLDVNGLKKTNDEQGHQAGDDLIKLVANVIESAFPGQAYRIGGDEFVAVCPNMVQDEFEQKLEIVRKKVGSGATAKASICALWSSVVLDLYKIVDCADEKMYEMKKIYHESNG